ncbi:MAG: hypothetical protein WA294_01595 [Acidobacteriaceae bacterium]
MIQAILRHSDIGVTRDAYIDRDAADPQSLAAVEALQALVNNQSATEAAHDRTGAVIQ